MTTMDSDSASQDSDDGRRFRFETTRKDSVASIDTMESLRKESKHKSQCENSKHYREKKERSKNESGRKMDHKDFGHSVKHSKHESRSSKQENSRDASTESASNDRDSKNFSGDDTWERSRDSKWQTGRNRSQSQRSRERSYDRNHHDDRHRSRCHERYKHRSRDGSRDRSHQSSRIKSSNSDHWSRDDHGSRRHDSLKKTSVKENRSQNFKDHFSPKNVEQTRSYNNAHSSINLERNPSVKRDIQDSNLSQFDVFETDENASGNRNSRSPTLSLRSRNTKLKLKRHDSKTEVGNSTKRTREDDDETSKMEQREELNEVKRRNDTRSGSNNNIPSTISDSSLNAALSATLPITKEIWKENLEGENSGYCEQEKTIAYTNTSKCPSLEERYPRCLNVSSDDTQLLEKDAKRMVYGPLLPPGFLPDTFDSDKFEEISTVHDENIDENDKSDLIGPRLSPRLNEEEESNIAKTIATSTAKGNVTFGPALPPHLLQQQCRDNSQNEIIGPVLPTTAKLCEKDSGASSESDNDCAIGPLPMDHPALRNNRVYEQLNLRAQKIRDERCLETIDVKNQREEWMTDLPPVQAANLGLGPRKFKLRDGPDISDRSCWTDTPAQKAQKQKSLEAKVYNNAIESDTKYNVKDSLKESTRQHKGKEREKSLLEMHQKKVAKRKKNEEEEAKRTGISTRRPFDRNTDLQIRFDQAQKKTVLLKARLLDDRFSRGQI
ncbi:hypothetical protein DMN91_006545 [Ooceraea biroi]|uniref:DUF3752 domain-containing protein n=1 Tax=Ooceraea biroi TaxID=2015173 RepID=A0A026WF16_OOCBI|nr:uncharacterized protein LOC105280195 [Ooceraea biroi]XP_026825827.1 uncharacterized protein LOC105280195 [Ooceraea biroi]XP_026825828.1 uncharacterized protein LOC105280195 [Ooceraea biroi]XP_026825829.1 uncharacterized protein LOC105280195 [Ooceraea biroi]XP_026825830.1 uncharacterized protein LOC105280195 [Ooceraea biroi]XP_026825831.1 uncharacterized protein LOC105280195 [Ooceraea biroi]XP_026825833.1 uncharacterized protein LOC105280195 [Ooceraea biroi]EZA54276.1 hypothetical protein 